MHLHPHRQARGHRAVLRHLRAGRHHDRLCAADQSGARPAAARRSVGRQSLLHGLPVHAHEPRGLALSILRHPRRRGDRAEFRHRDRLDHRGHRLAGDLQPDAPRSGRGRAAHAARIGRGGAPGAPRARQQRRRVRLFPPQRAAGGGRFLRPHDGAVRRHRRQAARQPGGGHRQAVGAGRGGGAPAGRRRRRGEPQHERKPRGQRAAAVGRDRAAVGPRRRDLGSARGGGRRGCIPCRRRSASSSSASIR